jgi:hypothetical protein
MLDSPEGVCAGQVGFKYPATSVPFSKPFQRNCLVQKRPLLLQVLSRATNDQTGIQNSCPQSTSHNSSVVESWRLEQRSISPGSTDVGATNPRPPRCGSYRNSPAPVPA